MGFDNRYEGIDEYAVRIIKHKARQLVGRAGFTESDREDLEQEMMLDLLRRLPKFDPKRAGQFVTDKAYQEVLSGIDNRTTILSSGIAASARGKPWTVFR